MGVAKQISRNKIASRLHGFGILWAIILVSMLVRGFIAWYIELGNDEVYYWTYALYPDLSHFDHPPMVGFVIQLFTLNLHFDSELFIRLASVVFGGINTLLIFLIAKKVHSSRAGIYAALLYNSSVYCFVIAGIFILPDTPQLLFWLLSLYMLIIALPGKTITKSRATILFFASIPLGLAMLSKYTSVFLWLGAGLYILFYNREWLKKGELYLAIIISLLIFSPVILWNIENEFISFTFQSERVSFFGSGLRIDYFLTELFGQIFYNNPVNFILIIVALIALFSHQINLDTQDRRLLLLTSLPLILLFLFFALFRRTLPHWTAPAYISLIVIAAVYLADQYSKTIKRISLPWPIWVSGLLLVLVLSVGLIQIKTGAFYSYDSDDPKKLGEDDLTLDMYGWEQFADRFSEIAQRDYFAQTMNADAPIIAGKWFPAAHLDYYVARPYYFNLLAVGELDRIHKYAWINRERPELRLGGDAYYITNSRNYTEPDFLKPYFASIDAPEQVRIYKGNKHVENFFVFRLRYCLSRPPDVLESYGLMEDMIGVEEE